ncbi:MAG: electron transfer flavoprotein subunit alpha/FixB family protein [Desulfobacterales bacterium]
MSANIFTYVLHKDGIAHDTAFELLSAAGKIDPNASVTALVAGSGTELEKVVNQIKSSFHEVWKIDHQSLSYVIADTVRPMLARIIPKESIVLIAHEHFGMDLAPGLSIKLGAAFIPDVIAFEEIKDGKIKVVREEFSGQVSTHVLCDISQGVVISVRGGAFKPEESTKGHGKVVDKTPEAYCDGVSEEKRRYLEIIEAETGDVDITKSDVLVSVGRGIEDQDNMDIIYELAEAMGGDVSCSRPIVDAKWLDKSRQVGTSGKTVKPKVYLALGISGSFQHLGGIKGSPFIIAVNKNPKAPIFQVADVGIVADILDFVPELTSKISQVKG